GYCNLRICIHIPQSLKVALLHGKDLGYHVAPGHGASVRRAAGYIRPAWLRAKKGRAFVQQTVEQLAALVQGKVHGDGTRVIQAAKTVNDARAGDITFVENEHYVRMMSSCQAS